MPMIEFNLSEYGVPTKEIKSLLVMIFTHLICLSIAVKWRSYTSGQHGQSYFWSPLDECRVKEHI